MPKPTYSERYTASGDTIPSTRSEGDGSGGTRPYCDTGDAVGSGGSYPTGTKFIGYAEDVHPSQGNRAHWFLWNAIDYLNELQIAMPYGAIFTDGGEGDRALGDFGGSFVVPVFLGRQGYNADDAKKVAALRDTVGDSLYLGGTAYYVSDMRTATGGGGVSLYPAGGLPAINTTPGLVDSTSGTSLVLQGAITGTAQGVSLFNYSLWLRGIRDGDTKKYDAWASITVHTDTTHFTMHRDVQTLGWVEDDEIYITHYASKPYATFVSSLPSTGNSYKIHYALSVNFGGLDILGTLLEDPQPSGTTQVNKLVNLTEAISESAGWSYSSFSGSGSVWNSSVSSTGPAKIITIPIRVPQYATINDVQLRYYCDVALSTDSSMTLYKETWGSGRTSVATYSFDANGSTIEPKLTDGAFGGSEQVDLETNEYYLEVSSGFDASSVSVHNIYACRVKFTYQNDHGFPE